MLSLYTTVSIDYLYACTRLPAVLDAVGLVCDKNIFGAAGVQSR